MANTLLTSDFTMHTQLLNKPSLMNKALASTGSPLTHISARARQLTSSLLAAGMLATLGACGGSSGTGNTPVTPVITDPVKPSSIAISNFSNNETLRYSLPVLNGSVPAGINSVKLTLADKSFVTDVVDGNFKALIPLQNGANDITISAGDQSSKIRLNYLPADNPKKVRMMYAIAADDDGRFVAEPGMSNTIDDAKSRLVLQALLMQSATAEMMYKASKQRLTYALVEDDKGKPAISTLRLSLTREQLYQKTDQELYQVIAQALADARLTDNVKNMVTMGFSTYRNGQILGLAALGGGNLGIFGSLHLYACPTSLEQLPASFSNAKVIDTSRYPDDSGGRASYWAQCATGMGASLHELGHSFDLEHTPTGIMSRGFDNFNRLFTMREPGYPATLTLQNEGGAIWDPASSAVLLRSEWLKK